MLIFAGILSAIVLSGQGQNGQASDAQNQGKVEQQSEFEVSSIEFQNVDVGKALKTLFKNIAPKYWIDLDLEGAVTLSMKRVPFSVVLDSILKQVGGEYSIERGTYVIRKKDFSLDQSPGAPVSRASFEPGSFTSQFDFRNPALFKSPLGTKGGTFDLLLEAVRVAKFNNWHVRTYGQGGFAIILPFEFIDATGRPMGRERFTFGPAFWKTVSFQKIGDYVSHEFDPPIGNHRVIVLTAAPGSEQNTKPQFIYDNQAFSELPTGIRLQKWEGAIKVSAFVYEFSDGSPVTPNKNLGSKKMLLAKAHLVAAGLWSNSLLR